MRPIFDEKDEEIRQIRIKLWQSVEGPRVGDFCRMLDGTMRRFTHDHGEDIQVTCGDDHPCAGDQRFYFAGEYMTFSGSLDPPILKSELRDTGETRDGACWFFHHGYVAAHSGVYMTVPCRVYAQVQPER